MMHLQLIGLVMAIAGLSRWLIGRQLQAQPTCPPHPSEGSYWRRRWQRAIAGFTVPPLLMLATALSIVLMGISPVHPWEGWVSYGLALCYVVATLGSFCHLYRVAYQTQQAVAGYPRRWIGTGCYQTAAQVIEAPTLFSAQVGLWSSRLVVSTGLLAALDEAHLAAVVAHEQAHAHYRDTFWFFWLGLLRQFTAWLPMTECFWQELLLLREVRADQRATQRVDALVLAESLMQVIQTPPMAPEAICSGFNTHAPCSRLAQRIDALLAAADGTGTPAQVTTAHPSGISVLLICALVLSPFILIPFHY